MEHHCKAYLSIIIIFATLFVIIAFMALSGGNLSRILGG